MRELRLGDGRRLTWIEFGDPRGQPVLFLHMDYGLIRWPAQAERHAHARRLRVVVPVRAGYGRTDLHARGVDHLAGVTQDYAAVMDHLGLRGAIAIPMGADLRFAMNLANRRPDLVAASSARPASCRSAARRNTTAWTSGSASSWPMRAMRRKCCPSWCRRASAWRGGWARTCFFRQVNGNSPADMETFSIPEVREAILEGSDTCLARKWSAHEAFTRECIGSEKDWSQVVRDCRVPVVLLQGDQDPQSPVLTIRELAAEYPHLDVRFLPNTGSFCSSPNGPACWTRSRFWPPARWPEVGLSRPSAKRIRSLPQMGYARRTGAGIDLGAVAVAFAA